MDVSPLPFPSQNGVNGHIPNGTVHPEDKVDVEKGSPNLKGNRTDIALTDRPTNGQVCSMMYYNSTGNSRLK